MSSPAEREVAAERLLDHDPGAAGQTGVGQPGGDVVEQARRDRQVEHRVLDALEALGQPLEGLRLPVVAAHVAEGGGEPSQHRLVDGPRRRPPPTPGPGSSGLVVPVGGGDADDREAVELAPLGQVVERREELLVGQVAGGPEQRSGRRLEGGNRRPAVASSEAFTSGRRARRTAGGERRSPSWPATRPAGRRSGRTARRRWRAPAPPGGRLPRPSTGPRRSPRRSP